MIEALRDIPGAGSRTADERDPRIGGVAPAVVVEPEHADVVVHVVKLCASNGWHIEPCGGATFLDVRDAPNIPYVLLSTRRLDTIEDYRPEDLTITAGSGVTFSALQDVLRTNRQWLALDPPMLGGATLGGVVATANAGPLRARYGTPRDHVLGLEMVTGDGRLLRFGGQVVKNVAGYDIVRPVVGSRGTLGVITRVSLRLRPLHSVDATMCVRLPLADAVTAAQSVALAWPVAALEILNARTATLVLPTAGTASIAVPPAGHADSLWSVMLRIHGHEAEVAEGVERITDVLRGSGPARLPDEVASSAWRTLSETEAAGASYIRLAAVPSHLGRTVRIANMLSDRLFGGSAAVAMHGRDGVVRLWKTAVGDAARSATGARLDTDFDAAISAAAGEMEAIDGTVSVDGKAAASQATSSERITELNRGIMELFDPAGIMPRYRL